MQGRMQWPFILNLMLVALRRVYTGYEGLEHELSVTRVHLWCKHADRDRERLEKRTFKRVRGKLENKDDNSLIVDKQKVIQESVAASVMVRNHQVDRLKYYGAVVNFDIVDIDMR